MAVGSKVCIKCNLEKNISEFQLRSDTEKYRNECKICRKKYHKKYNKNWYKENKEKRYEETKKYLQENPVKRKKYYKKYYDNNLDKVLEKNKKFNENNPKKVKEYRKRIYQKQKLDPQKRIKRVIGSKISLALSRRGGSKNGLSSFDDILPYTVEELKNHLESLFEEGMSWDNYGKGDDCWHIDHKIPDSWFNYKSPNDEEFQNSWSLKNLKPMWQKENLKKRNKYIG